MRVNVGTSGYAYKEWKPSFYPKDVPAKGMLSFYATKLDTVEINNSFYRLPERETVERWASEVPAGFTFALKAPQTITHRLRLVGAAAATKDFIAIADLLGKRMAPLLFQLPPFQKKDLPRLRSFLADLPKRVRVAFEFRHESWFEADVFDVLREHGAALCIAEADDLKTPIVATTDWGYLRLRRDDYTTRAVTAWAPRILEQPWKEAFVFMKHDEGKAPVFAQALAKALAAHCERPARA
jgi:uncharacterized protein YecE (DUF72 family)